jgi:hypothetical protein
MKLEEVYERAEELHCSPGKHHLAEKDKTCFTHGELKLLAKEFNKKSPKKIKGKTKKELVHGLLTSFKDICDKHQFCWIRQVLTDSEKIRKLEDSFRPQKPKSWDSDPNTWLNTYDILYVLSQYEHLYKDYRFLNVTPIDFAEYNSFGKCIGDMLCDFDIKKDILDYHLTYGGKKRYRFGIVFNTDDSHSGGAHWISLYCNLNPKKPNYGIYFYDSVASRAPGEVKDFMSKIVEQVKTYHLPKAEQFEKKENKIQRQFSNYDCGVFSIVIQTQLLKGVVFDVLCKKMKTDRYINSLRNILYRPNI